MKKVYHENKTTTKTTTGTTAKQQSEHAVSKKYNFVTRAPVGNTGTCEQQSMTKMHTIRKI
jgi:hypothetical protein